ncbi:hypothetical protein CDAR_172341 [Caerostris darwini]|uniref:Uncharacterized protein n=1 Tax=Caerostris darwini TaxID=1538125 RepID=A0AAV4MIV4_9ARAC|nr:hypothetical protein CDAR_172341 [Caerostris darwini]
MERGTSRASTGATARGLWRRRESRGGIKRSSSVARMLHKGCARSQFSMRPPPPLARVRLTEFPHWRHNDAVIIF